MSSDVRTFIKLIYGFRCCDSSWVEVPDKSGVNKLGEQFLAKIIAEALELTKLS